MRFTEGQSVRKDDLLFTLDPRPQQAALKEAEAQLAKSRVEQVNAEKEAARQLPAVTLSFNLRPGVAIGDAVGLINELARRQLPATISGTFQGQAQAFQDSLKRIFSTPSPF